jgi:hypothetical protein
MIHQRDRVLVEAENTFPRNLRGIADLHGAEQVGFPPSKIGMNKEGW